MHIRDCKTFRGLRAFLTLYNAVSGVNSIDSELPLSSIFLISSREASTRAPHQFCAEEPAHAAATDLTACQSSLKQ
jgi:hypothetical protein